MSWIWPCLPTLSVTYIIQAIDKCIQQLPYQPHDTSRPLATLHRCSLYEIENLHPISFLLKDVVAIYCLPDNSTTEDAL